MFDGLEFRVGGLYELQEGFWSFRIFGFGAFGCQGRAFSLDTRRRFPIAAALRAFVSFASEKSQEPSTHEQKRWQDLSRDHRTQVVRVKSLHRRRRWCVVSRGLKNAELRRRPGVVPTKETRLSRAP